MTRKWKYKKSPDKDLVNSLKRELGVKNKTIDLLVQRGIVNYEMSEKYFRPKLDDLHSPFLMKNMSLAVEILKKNIKTNKNILIYGDYDVDGTTSISVLYLFLKKITNNLYYYTPDRYNEGYGLSINGIDYAKKNKCSLIIVLDCGIKAVSQVEYANEIKIDTIICDHHTPGEILPKASAVLNPKQKDCNYPFKDLSACGVGFKLVQAYCEKNNIPFNSIKPFFDLLAISIVADIVPLTGENRIFTYYGIKQLNTNPSVGLKSLISLMKKSNTIGVSDIGFFLAPRINAAGRMSHANKAVELLIEQDISHAQNMSNEINNFNLNRREIDQKITKEASDKVPADNKSTVVYSSQWHKGVIGIVASKLIEKHYRPTIVFTESNGFYTGSARSIKGFNIYDAISSCTELVEQYGGHKYAAGLTVKKNNIHKFINKFENVVRRTIDDEMLMPIIDINMHIKFSEISTSFLKILKQMGPFGPGNHEPIFITKNVKIDDMPKKVGKDNTHLKISLIHEKFSFEAIGFNMANVFNKIIMHKKFDIVYQIKENNWNGLNSIQLLLKDIKF